MAINNLVNNSRQDAYEAELDRLIAISGPVRSFTDEENMKLARDLSEGLYEFHLAQTKRDVEAMIESRTVHVGYNNSTPYKQ